MKDIFCFLILLTSFNILLADDKEPIYYWGAYLGYNYNIHFADFQQLPEIPSCCPKYTNGDGIGFSLGALFERPINRAVSLSVRLGYSVLNAILVEDEYSIGNTLVLNNNNPIITDISVKHKLDSKLSLIGIEPAVEFKFFRDLYMTAGFRFGYLINAKVDHSETIIYPDNVVFLDGRRIRNDIYNREIPERKDFHFFGLFGLGYQFSIGEKTFLEPELRYFIPFINISNVNWKPASLLMGLAIKFPIYEERKLPVIEDIIFERDTTIIAVLGISEPKLKLMDESIRYRKDTTDEAIFSYKIIKEHYELQIPKEAKIFADFNVVGIAKDGTKQNNPIIIIEELETEESFPLLPHIFFPQNSSDLQKTGMNLINIEQIHQFDDKNLPWNTMKIYSDLLNIVGYRMQKNKKAILTITGCNNNTGVESNNLELSKNRAEAVKNYLTQVWAIESNRLKVVSRNLPEKPANNSIEDGIQENQRVELSSNDLRILSPVMLKEIVRKSNPPVIQLIPHISSEAELKEWSIEIKQKNKLIRQFSSTEKPFTYSWIVEEEPIPALEENIETKLSAYDILNNKAEASKDINIQQLTIRKKRFEMKDDKKVEKYSLILFDYDKAEITPLHRTILNEIKDKITPTSTVRIYGFADRTGESQYNKDLAMKRANEVQKIIKVNEKNLDIIPVGSDILLYDNDLPQGRGYSRTVQIEIETPIK